MGMGKLINHYKKSGDILESHNFVKSKRANFDKEFVKK
jgi:hypothetical protein